LLWAGVGGWTGEKSGRQRPSAALPGGGRESHCSGEIEIKAGHPAVAVALVNAGGKVDWPRELAGTRLDGGGHGGRRRSKERRGRGAHRLRRRGGSVFKVGSRCYATLLRAQRLTGAIAAYGGAASRAVPAGARVGGGATRGGHGHPRHPGVWARLGKALYLGGVRTA
jgi:hypothetical protein